MRLIPELGLAGDVPPPVRLREEVFVAVLRLPPRLEPPAVERLRVLLLVGTGRGERGEGAVAAGEVRTAAGGTLSFSNLIIGPRTSIPDFEFVTISASLTNGGITRTHLRVSQRTVRFCEHSQCAPGCQAPKRGDRQAPRGREVPDGASAGRGAAVARRTGATGAARALPDGLHLFVVDLRGASAVPLNTLTTMPSARRATVRCPSILRWSAR